MITTADQWKWISIWSVALTIITVYRLIISGLQWPLHYSLDYAIGMQTNYWPLQLWFCKLLRTFGVQEDKQSNLLERNSISEINFLIHRFRGGCSDGATKLQLPKEQL